MSGENLAEIWNKAKEILKNETTVISYETYIQTLELKSFDNNKDVACYILENLDKSNTIFLKASRSMKFEQILEEIKKRDI